MGRGHSTYAHGMRTARAAEQRGGCPRATCGNCGRLCKVYWPTGGDGSVRITFWHKDPQTGKWCRAEVDEWTDPPDPWPAAAGSPTVDGAGRGRFWQGASGAPAGSGRGHGPRPDDDVDQDAEPPEWGPVGPYRGERVHVLADRCTTCIFRGGNLMRLMPGRVKDMVATCQRKQGVITCHSTLGTDEPAICRGFFDRYGQDIWPLRLARALNVITYDPVPVKVDA